MWLLILLFSITVQANEYCDFWSNTDKEYEECVKYQEINEHCSRMYDDLESYGCCLLNHGIENPYCEE